MYNVYKKYDNIYWFLIDGLRPDFLHINQKIGRQNFIDKLCSMGTTFDHVMTAGGGTFTSMHSVFTSLLPSYNGMTGFNKETFRKFNQEIFTITDYFQLAGYETFRYGDTDLSRAVPMSGFKRWEGSGYKGGRVLKNTRLTQTKRRNRFIEDVNRCRENKFVYHHIDLLHDLNGSLETFWSNEDYAKNVEITAEEFEKLYHEYEITENDLVILSSDHGVILNLDFIEDNKIREQRQYEQSIWAFFTLIGKDIPSQLLREPISSLDEMPTILHLSFEKDIPMNCQGQDQYLYIYDGKYQENMFFRETNRYGTMEINKPDVSTLFCVRDGKWKYLYGSEDARCEWLMDLDRNTDYEENLKDLYPEITKKYNWIIRNKFESAKDFVYQSAFEITKRELPKMFSVVLQMDCIEEETIASLMDMSGPYYEIIALESELTLRYRNQYKMCYTKSFEMDELCSVCKGEWIIFITENGEWSEYFLSDLYRYMQWHRNNDVKIGGGGI